MYFQNNLIKLDSCIACGHENLVPVLDLGTQPLANSYRESLDETLEKFPLAINHCSNCFHVQLTHAVNPALMFKEYLYVSGTSQTMKEHFKWFAEWASEYYNMLSVMKPVSVLDIGCNDGSQLDAFLPLGLRTYGVDPAENLVRISSQKHTVWNQYFNSETVVNTIGRHSRRIFDILIAQNVFAHHYNPKDFLKAARMLMGDSSLLFIQTSQADMILKNEFDTIYHEHISFYNTKSMNELCNSVGMHILDVIKCPLHGNSYIFVISKERSLARPFNVQNVMAMERKEGLYDPETYVKYFHKCDEVISTLNYMLETHKKNGWTIAGYGAAAKGMTVLNAAHINSSFMSVVVDDNELKQGRYTPGSNIPIVGPEYLFDTQENVLFVPLAWNFFSEIKGKIKTYRPNNADLFLTYFPKVVIHGN